MPLRVVGVSGVFHSELVEDVVAGHGGGHALVRAEVVDDALIDLLETGDGILECVVGHETGCSDCAMVGCRRARAVEEEGGAVCEGLGGAGGVVDPVEESDGLWVGCGEGGGGAEQ